MLPLFDIGEPEKEQIIRFTTYDMSPRKEGKKRKPKIEIEFAINEIMALTTARGEGKWPKLFVSNYSKPLELPDQSFGDTKAKLIRASLTQYQNINKFIPVGSTVLVNYEKVFQVRKLSGEIILFDDRILDGFDAEMLAEYERLSEIEHKKLCEQSREGTRMYLERLAKWQQEETYKRANKFTRIFGTLDDKMAIYGFLVIINIVLSILLIIMIGILLYKL